MRPRSRRDNGLSNNDEAAKTNVSQFYESGQGSPDSVTTWADTLSYMPRSSTNEVANHKHEYQTCYFLVAGLNMCTKVHDNKVGVPT